MEFNYEVICKDEKLMDVVSKFSLIHPEFCLFCRKKFEAKVGSLFIPETARERRDTATNVGILLKFSEIESDKSDTTRRKEYLKVGDTIGFHPTVPANAGVEEYPELYVIHIEDILSVRR